MDDMLHCCSSWCSSSSDCDTWLSDFLVCSQRSYVFLSCQCLNWGEGGNASATMISLRGGGTVSFSSQNFNMSSASHHWVDHYLILIAKCRLELPLKFDLIVLCVIHSNADIVFSNIFNTYSHLRVLPRCPKDMVRQCHQILSILFHECVDWSQFCYAKHKPLLCFTSCTHHCDVIPFVPGDIFIFVMVQNVFILRLIGIRGSLTSYCLRIINVLKGHLERFEFVYSLAQ